MTEHNTKRPQSTRNGLGPLCMFGFAHRASYEYMRAEIPEGLTIDHLCRNRRCVNPDHLDPVTTRVNNARSQDGRTSAARRVWAAKKAA